MNNYSLSADSLLARPEKVFVVLAITSRCQWGPAIMGILGLESWVVRFMSGEPDINLAENDIVTRLSLSLTSLASVLKTVAGLVLSMNVSQPVKDRKSLNVNIIVSLTVE